jgi:dihydrofolate synthase/folylpolyglutamate synthase
MSIKFEMVLEDLYKLTLSQRPIIRKNYNLLRIRRLLNELGNPQNKIQVIHIAGTSGKGSTSTILSTILTSQGFKTGLFISPHMISLNERIQINNLNISDEDFINVYEKVKTIIIKINKKEEQEVTFFEALTAMAFYHFAEQKVDYAVIETGLGGIVDPTNIVEDKDKIAIITKIGFDHTDILGKTLTLIAKQKAGIIHNKNVCISAAQKPQVTKVLESACQSTKSNFFQIGNI